MISPEKVIIIIALLFIICVMPFPIGLLMFKFKSEKLKEEAKKKANAELQEKSENKSSNNSGNLDNNINSSINLNKNPDEKF